MLNEIEDIERYLNERKGRQPASVGQVIDEKDRPMNVDGYVPDETQVPKKIFKRSLGTPFSDESVNRVLPSANGGETVVGGRAPDYSGYDAILDKYAKKNMRDTSTADLINMGISTGIGLLFGRPGTGAKVAGEYGLQRAAKAEKKADDFDDLLTKIELAKAAQMAKGAKGQKVKSGGGSDAYGKAYQNRYLAKDGTLRTPTYQDEVGRWIPDVNDPVYQAPDIKTFETPNADGSVSIGARRGNEVITNGVKPKDAKLATAANGDQIPYNPATVMSKGLGDFFNKTETGFSEYASNQYNQIKNSATTDPALRGTTNGHSEVKAGMIALSRGTVGAAKIAVKKFASALENAHRVTDFDVKYAKDLNTGIFDKIDKALAGLKDGEKLPDNYRAELESAYATLESGIARAHEDRLSQLDRSARSSVGKEYDSVPEKSLRKIFALTPYKRETQSKDVDRILHNEKEWMSSPEWTEDIVLPNGQTVKGTFIMKNGRKYQTGFAK